MKEVKEAIKKLADKNESVYSIKCTVTSVNLTKKTCYCEPIDEGQADIADVKLIADSSKNGFMVIPKMGSVVFVSMTSNQTGYLSMWSEVDSIEINGDTYGGLVKVQELTDKLNNLEDAFNQHVLLYNTHTHAGVTAGGSITAIPSAIDTNILTPTVKTELENLTTSHGNGN